MPEFVLDTEGYVERHDGARLHWHDDLTPFVQGYISAMFADLEAAACFPVFDDGWRRARFADLSPETLLRIVEDCERNPNSQPHKEWMGDPERAARHGRYAWEDRPASVKPYLGDDGKVYLS